MNSIVYHTSLSLAMLNLQLWIGLGFTTVLVVFFLVAFFLRPNLTADQRHLIRILASLCAAFAGALITGGAVLEMQLQLGKVGTIAVTGTAGFSLFFTVWFTLFPPPHTPPDSTAFSYKVVTGWTFSQVVNEVAIVDKCTVELLNFTEEQLNTLLTPREVHAKSPLLALESLRHLGGALPKYKVEKDKDRSHYKLIAQQ